MKKKDIIRLLEYRKSIYESNIGKSKNYWITIDELENPLKDLYPDIKELQEEFAIIDKEFKQIRDERRKHEEYIKNSEEEVKKIYCDHPIIFKNRFELGSECHCALCNQETYEKEKRVRLVRYDPECEIDSYYILNTYNEKVSEYYRLYYIIKNMLQDKDDEEEIDFTKLFNKSYENYNIGEIEIDYSDDIEDTYKVLVISGSNKISIQGIDIKKENSSDDIVIDFLKQMDNCEIDRISSLNNKYQTIEELKEILQEISSIDYDIILDLTRLFNYQIIDNEIKIVDVVLDLQNYFPNSTILTTRTIQEEINMYEELKNILIKKTKIKTLK